MKPLEYHSPMKHRIDSGEIVCGGWEIATMISTDDLISTDIVTYQHGSDGGGLQLEIDEIGEKLVRAYNAHDQLLIACQRTESLLGELHRHLPGLRAVHCENVLEAVRAAIAAAEPKSS